MHTPIDYLFNNASYQRFHSAATVLERFVASAPRAVRLDQLINDAEIGAAEIRKTCARLCRLGLIIANEQADQWVLASEPGEVTLEDVLRSVISDGKAVRADPSSVEMRGPAGDIDLLISQALLAINQSISTQLRKVQLDRVSAVRCGWLHIV